MKRSIVLAAFVFALTVISAQAGEKKLTKSQLPAAVQKAVDEQSQGATVKGFAEEKENGQTMYEAELLVDGHSKDVLMDASGKVVEVEEQVALDSLPQGVQDGLKKAAGSGKISKVESLTKNSKLVAYEAVVSKAGKKSEIQVGPDGSKLAHKE